MTVMILGPPHGEYQEDIMAKICLGGTASEDHHSTHKLCAPYIIHHQLACQLLLVTIGFISNMSIGVLIFI